MVAATAVCHWTGQMKQRSVLGHMLCSRIQTDRQFNEINVDVNADKAT